MPAVFFIVMPLIDSTCPLSFRTCRISGHSELGVSAVIPNATPHSHALATNVDSESIKIPPTIYACPCQSTVGELFDPRLVSQSNHGW